MPSFSTRAIELSFGEANSLPTEFQLFVRGWNKTEKGDFLFDEAAAAAVLAAYRDWGVDLAIDLEHQMLDQRPQPDPTARDARGSFKLELRLDGSLWAVDVKWTQDGAARLSQKRQRYVSPAFMVDPQTKRVTKVLNVAITAMPATHNTPALVAAAARGTMTLEAIKAALEALVAGDHEAAAKQLQDMIAEAAAGGAEAAPAAAPAETSAPAAEEQPAAAALPPAAPASEEEDEEKKQMTARLIGLTAKPTVTAALDEVEVWRASHIARETDRVALEGAERRNLCVELIKLGAEFPATVWADEKAKTLKPRWLSISLSALREQVVEQKSARGKVLQITPPAGQAASAPGSKSFSTPDGEVTLSARELKTCTETKADPQVYANNKALQAKARAGR